MIKRRINIQSQLDAVNQAAAQALQSAQSAVAVSQGQATLRPKSTCQIFNFATSKTIPKSIYFSRNSIATYVDRKGIIRTAKVNQPRFTHDPATLEPLGLWVEEARTNYATNSTAISPNNSFFITTNGAIAPDGTATATILEKNSTQNSTFYSNVDTASLANGFYVRSFFITPLQQDECIIVFEGIGAETGNNYVTFNVLTKTFSGNVPALINYGCEEYQNGAIRPWIAVEKSSTKVINNVCYLGGYGGLSTPTNKCKIWGWQFENGKKVSTYIPTQGTILTRQAEYPRYRISYLNTNQFTVSVTGVKTNNYEINENGYNCILGLSGSQLMGVFPAGNGGSIWDGTTVIPTPTFGTPVLRNSLFNAVIAVNSNSQAKITYNGSAIASGTINSVMLTFQDWYIGSRNRNFLNGTIKCIEIYNQALSDVELQELSSLNRLAGTGPNNLPTNNQLGSCAFLDVESLMSSLGRQHFTIDGPGASITRNIRFNFDFDFEIVDSSGCSITSQPSASCPANTDNALVFSAPQGKSLTYAIIPKFEY